MSPKRRREPAKSRDELRLLQIDPGTVFQSYLDQKRKVRHLEMATPNPTPAQVVIIAKEKVKLTRIADLVASVYHAHGRPLLDEVRQDREPLKLPPEHPLIDHGMAALDDPKPSAW
jgi:hypothetical protein